MPEASPSSTALPWKLLLASGLLGCSLPWLTPSHEALPFTAGRARLADSLRPGQSGWQLQIDPQGLRLRPSEVQAILGSPPLSWAGAVPAALPPSELWELRSHDGREATLSTLPAPDPSTLPRRTPLAAPFSGRPSVVFEWSRGALSLRGTLSARSHGLGVWSGRLMGLLPFSGWRPAGSGFPVDGLTFLPRDAQRVLVVQPTGLRLLPTYRDSLVQEWSRWEFFPLRDLRQALGSSLVYTQWRGEALFFFSLRDQAAVEGMLSARFPESTLPGVRSRRLYGRKATSLGEQGPAWLLQGDQLVVTPSGGLPRLEAYLESRLGEAAGASPDDTPFWREIQRLAAQEPDGWHALVIRDEPGQALRYAALLRWPDPNQIRATGYWVVERRATLTGPNSAKP